MQPLAIVVHKSFRRVERLADWLVGSAGPVFICIASFLVWLCAYTFCEFTLEPSDMIHQPRSSREGLGEEAEKTIDCRDRVNAFLLCPPSTLPSSFFNGCLLHSLSHVSNNGSIAYSNLGHLQDSISSTRPVGFHSSSISFFSTTSNLNLQMLVFLSFLSVYRLFDTLALLHGNH